MSPTHSSLSLLAVVMLACGGGNPPAASAPPTPTEATGASVDWPITGDIVRDASPPHSFHASRTVKYPEITAGMAEPAWSSPDAPVGTLSLWFHLGAGELAPGAKLKVVSWDNEPLHHCLHEQVDAPFVEARYVESVRGTRVFPSGGGSDSSVAGELAIDAPSSTAKGSSGKLDVTLTDAGGHKRHILARVQFDPPTKMWDEESRDCPKG